MMYVEQASPEEIKQDELIDSMYELHCDITEAINDVADTKWYEFIKRHNIRQDIAQMGDELRIIKSQLN